MRAWYSGRTTHFQCVDESSILSARTNNKVFIQSKNRPWAVFASREEMSVLVEGSDEFG